MGREARAKRTDGTASDKRSQLSTLFERAKRATVAIAFMRPAESPTNNPPFEIVGSGVCIDEKGVVITCRHVLQSFVRKDLDAVSLPSGGQPHRERVQIVGVPHALFYVLDPASTEVVVECVSLQTCETTPERDICVAWVSPCERFARSFPALAIEDFDEVHEGMELATCGFPLGNVLFKQLGTVSSSFTRGSLSSIVPVANASREQVLGGHPNPAISRHRKTSH